MRPTFHAHRLTLLTALCATLAACASTQPLAYSGLVSAPQLAANHGPDADRIAYRTDTHPNWSAYTRLSIAPVVVYRGPDAQFDDVSEDGKAELAASMREEFTRTLQPRFALSEAPAPGTLLVKLTLTGAKSSTRFLSTATRFDLVGAPYNIVQTIRGKEGSFTGSVSFAVEIFDAATHQLLAAYVSKQYPSPMNIKASLGALDASKAGIRLGAEELLKQMK